jgi:uncharacterized protein (DUF1778 family)
MSTSSRNLTEKSDARLNFRLPQELKEIIEQAAAASGQTVTDYAVSTLVDSARRTLDEQLHRKLSDRDRDVFLRMLEAPATPNAALRRAAERYKRRRRTR